MNNLCYDINGNVLIIINPTMPQDYCNNLLVYFSIIFPKFEDIDSQADSLSPLFASIHLTWYNQFSTKVSFLFLFFLQQ